MYFNLYNDDDKDTKSTDLSIELTSDIVYAYKGQLVRVFWSTETLGTVSIEFITGPEKDKMSVAKVSDLTN